MGGDSSLETRVIEVGEEEREAEHVETTDYFFNKIGESVPLTPNNPSFDLQNPPSLPLAVSERFRLTFVGNSDGFCVAKTADIINLAKDIKSGRAPPNSSVLDVSVVQVPIGRVSILSLSTDSSTIAATVGGDIHFFSVKSLLAKEKEPCLLLPIESPNYVKQFCWTKRRDTSFVVLSNAGTMYRGDLKQSLKHVMDDVNAVEWSVKGEFLAVARKRSVSIMTPEFNERKQVVLEFKMGFADADEDNLIVDSIQWVRPDCIVVGSLQQSVAGREENYIVQVIMWETGQDITDASSRPEILFLSDLFLSIVDDIMPLGHGPHLLLNYLESRQLVALANRKNTDQHIALVGWLDDNNGPAVIHIERDNWLPRIELQDNGDENVLLAMCIDRASVYENIEVKIGEDDHRELSPYCIFLCLTHEGKLVLFHFASISGDSGAPTPSNEETISTSGIPDVPTISVERRDDKIKEVVLDQLSLDLDKDKIVTPKVDQNSLQRSTETSYSGKSSTSIPAIDQTSTMGRTTGMSIPTAKNQFKPSPTADVDKILGAGQSEPKENEYLKQIPLKSFVADAPKVNQSHGELLNHSVELDKRLGGGQSEPMGNEFLKQVPLKSFAENASKIDAGNLTKAENLKPVDRPDSDFPVGKNFPTSNLSHGDKLKSSVELGHRESRSNQPNVFRDVPEQGTTSLSGSFSSTGTMSINSRRATPAPTNVSMGIHSMHMSESLLPLKTVSNAHPMNVNPTSPSRSTHSKFEMSLSKKYGNMKEMTSELDKLLQCIEEPGGLIDNCSSSQKLLENLEETVADLCHKCTRWQSLHHEQGESIQNLLDITVQVLARRIYMEGIVKQSRDKNYWDLWNRQKLSSELQMRRQSMRNLSQDLINQLIELEKHFNTIELNNYGESSGVNLGHQSFRSKFTPSRQIQSLHAVHNSLSSQLAAAEQLSDCLSGQMSALSITSSSVKAENVKDQLFKMIGISSESHYEASSPAKKVINTGTSHATPLFSSVATEIGNDIRSNHIGTNSHEPETARRRRDSFDQNWANFEPSKTTIKRMQRGNELADVKKTSLFMDKRFSFSSDASADAGQATHLDFFHDARAAEDTSKKFLPRSSSKSSRDRDIHEPIPSSVNPVFGKQIFDKRALGALSPDSSKYSSGNLDLHVKKETSQIIAEGPGHASVVSPESVFLKERKTSFTFSQSSQEQPNVQSPQPLVSPFSKVTNNMPMQYKHKDSTASKHPGNIVEQKVSRSSPFVSGSSYETGSSQILSPSNQPATFSQLTTSKGVQSSDSLNTSSTANPSGLFASLVESGARSPFSSSSTPAGQKFFFTDAAGSLNSTANNQDTFRSASEPTNLAFSASSASSQNSLSSAKSIEKAAASSTASSANPIVKPLDTENQSSGNQVHAGSAPSDIASLNPVASSPMMLTINSTSKAPNPVPQPSSASKVDAGFLQKELPVGDINWNNSTFANSSGSHFSSSTPATNGSDVVPSNSEAKKSSGVFLFPQPTQVSAPAATTSTDSDVAQEEDEMEEEAPDTTSQAAAGLSLGSLGGLGFRGSSPSTNSLFTSNPFGGGPTSATMASIPSTDMTIPSGQLFRPASFSFPGLQPSQQQPQAQSTGGFMNLGTTNTLTPSVGQPTQTGSGRQALGSVLGSFGQSRQLGPALPGNNGGGGLVGGGASGGGFPNAGSGSGFSGGGFATGPSSGGFAGLAASGSGFGGGGFASLSTSGGGGFSGAASGGGGGFSGAAGGGGGGFGAFGNQGGGGFSSFGGGTGGKPAPTQLFTQIRK